MKILVKLAWPVKLAGHRCVREDGGWLDDQFLGVFGPRSKCVFQETEWPCSYEMVSSFYGSVEAIKGCPVGMDGRTIHRCNVGLLSRADSVPSIAWPVISETKTGNTGAPQAAAGLVLTGAQFEGHVGPLGRPIMENMGGEGHF